MSDERKDCKVISIEDKRLSDKYNLYLDDLFELIDVWADSVEGEGIRINGLASFFLSNDDNDVCEGRYHYNAVTVEEIDIHCEDMKDQIIKKEVSS